MAYHLSDPLLRECVASGQLEASQIHQHVQAGELQTSNAFIAAQCDRAGEAYPRDQLAPSDFTTVQSTLHRLQQEIADEAARSDVECIAQGVSSAPGTPVYNLALLSADLPTDDDMRESYRAALDKAVRYLDLRGLLVRPVAGCLNLVNFPRRS